MNGGAPSAADAAFEIDRQHPYPGLLAFRESESALFFGRAEEAQQLLRLVRRDVVTLLFGGSGLGKTSLIQAGLFPLLRGHDLLPVPIRVDFAADAAPPVSQIKAAIADSVAQAGCELERSGFDWDTVTLWELLHRSVLWSPTNRILQPVLVFDQFEELFTLGAGRIAANDLLTELEDAIENHIPAVVQERVEASGEALDFPIDVQSFRVLVSMREDFLPLLEPLCDGIPSLRRNRMRLAALSAEQALLAVCEPNPDLVDREVGEEIVQFVADTTERPFRRVGEQRLGAGAEVEPALLSLVCRELNFKRIRQGRDRITSDLLSAAKTGILSDFYERSLADLPAEVRLFVEDRLLTRTGYRNVVAMDDATAIEGVSREHLAALVDRRLIRLESRLGTQRVELTHDVLTRTIRKSRDSRRARTAELDRLEREREEMLQRQCELEEQHAAQRARNRRLAWLAAGLAGAAAAIAVVAVVLVILGLVAWRSAREAERQRLVAERALSFMLFDLREMVESTGRLDVIERAAREVLEHTAASDGETIPDGVARTREVAHVALGDVRRARGDLHGAHASYGAAMEIAARLAASSPDEPLWQHDLSVVHARIGGLRYQEGDLAGALAAWREEQAISRRLAESDPGNLDRQRELALCEVQIGNVLQIQGRVVEADAAFESAFDIMTRVVEAEPGSVLYRSDLASISVNRARMADVQGDTVGAGEQYESALGILRDLTAREPGNLFFASRQAEVEVLLGNLLLAGGDLERAQPLIAAAGQTWRMLGERDPLNADWTMGRASALAAASEVLRTEGRHQAALDALDERLALLEELAAQAPTSGSLLHELAANHAWSARLLIVMDQPTRALGAARSALAAAEALAARDPTNHGAARLVAACRQVVGDALLACGDPAGASARFRDTLSDMVRIRGEHPDALLFSADVVDSASRLSHALWLAGDATGAREAWQQALAGLRALELRSELAARRAIDGPLGAGTCCVLFRRPAEEGVALGIDGLDRDAATRKARAGALGFAARRQLLDGSFDAAVELSRQAIDVDPSQTWLRLALAHGELLAGREEAALEVYEQYRYHRVSDMLVFREAVLEDFEALRAAGLAIPAMAEVERRLAPPQ